VVAHGARGVDGDPYPGWHEVVEGSDGRASVKGGGSGASSTRRCSGHGGEERDERGGDDQGVAPFYRVGESAGWVMMAAVMHFQCGGRL
jgi:hypothetical protein